MKGVKSFESHDYLCVLHTNLICPSFRLPSSAYCQLVRLISILLLTALEACAGHGPPAEADPMEPVTPSMAEQIAQLVLPVRTVKYLLEPVDCCSTCKQSMPLHNVNICQTQFETVVGSMTIGLYKLQ